MDESELRNVAAENLSALRVMSGRTQLELANEINYSDKSVSKWERGESVPDVYVLRRLADIYGVSVDYLITPHKKIKLKKALSYKTIMLISAFGIAALALLLFIIFWILGNPYWQIFVYAMPVCFITLLCLNSVFRMGRQNMPLVGLLLFSIIATVYTVFLSRNWWQIFLLLIPGEILVFLCFRLFKKK